jgi:hypothetical protein
MAAHSTLTIKTEDHNVLNPTNISYDNLTILQHTFLRLFPNTTPQHFRILRAKPGEEIETFNEILTRTPSLILRDDRNVAIPIGEDVDLINPPADLVLAIVRSMAISYANASRYSPELRQAILSIPKGSNVFYIHSSSTEHTSFIYDGHKKPETRRLFKVRGNKNVVSKALERSKEAIQSEETVSLKVFTPTEAQDDLVNLLTSKLRLRVEEVDGDWTMELDAPVPLHKLYPYAFQTNRGFIRATHPGMLLPDTAPNQFIKHIESVGKTIARKNLVEKDLPEQPTSVELREYAAVEERVVGDTTILPVTKGNPYEMKSLYTFHRMRPILMPVM